MRTVVPWIVFCVVFGVGGAGDAKQPPGFNVATYQVRTGDHSQCIMEMQNLDISNAANVVEVRGYSHGVSIFHLGATLFAPSQSRTFEVSAPDGACRDGSIVAQVTYTLNGVAGGTIVGAKAVEPIAKERLPISQLAAWGLGLISAVLGAWFSQSLGSRLEERRERRAQAQAARQAYRTFLLNWDRSLLPAMLREQFRPILESVNVDANLYSLYRQTLGALADASASPAAKEASARTFDEFLRRRLSGDF